MKITRRQLKRIIKEELNRLNENTSGKPIPLMDRVWTLFPYLEASPEVIRRMGIGMALDPYINIMTTRSAGSKKDILMRVRGPEGVKNSARRKFLMELLGTDNPSDIDDLSPGGIGDLLRENGIEVMQPIVINDALKKAAAAYDEDNAGGVLDKEVGFGPGGKIPDAYEGQPK
jgi:hypothetical protein